MSTPLTADHPTFTPTIGIEPLADPTIELLGHDWRSAYTRRFWTPLVGPSCILVGCWIADQFDVVERFTVDLAELAPAVGLGHGPGRHAPLPRTLRRLADFELASIGFGRDETTVQVLRRVPELSQRRLRRLPAALQRAHDAMLLAVA